VILADTTQYREKSSCSINAAFCSELCDSFPIYRIAPSEMLLFSPLFSHPNNASSLRQTPHSGSSRTTLDGLLCAGPGPQHGIASSIPVGKSFDLFTVTHSPHSGMAVLPPFSPLRQYGLHPSISFQPLSSQTPPPLSETLLSLVSALMNTHPHSHPTLPCLCHTQHTTPRLLQKTQVC